jgi:hypothetical protein
MSRGKPSLARLRDCALAVMMVMLLVGWPLSAQAIDFLNRSLQLQNSSSQTTTTYQFSLTINKSATLGSLEILFCSNSPLQEDSCTPPTGMDVTNAVLSSQTGITNFIANSVSANEILLVRSPSNITPPLPLSLAFDNIVNPSAAGPYYARLIGYSSSDGTGSSVYFGGLAFAVVTNLNVTSVVPPYITFCSGLVISGFDCLTASGDYINFGDLSSAHSSQGTSQMLVATNAGNGYIIQVTGTTMTSGNNIIPALTVATGSQPGTGQFGINLRGNATPSIGTDPSGPGTGQPTAAYDQPNKYIFNSNDIVASSPNADDYRKYTVSYIVNSNAGQPAGVYVSTLTYVATGSF